MDAGGYPNYRCGAGWDHSLFLNPGGALAEAAKAFVLLVIDFLQSFLRRRRIHHSLSLTPSLREKRRGGPGCFILAEVAKAALRDHVL